MVKRIKEENIDLAIDRLITRTQATNEFFLQKMGKTIKEIGELTPSQARQLSQMLKYGDNYDEITEELARLTDGNVEDIYDIYEEVAKNDYAFAKQFYDYQGVEYTPYSENYALQNQIRAIASITASEYFNIANASTLGYGVIDPLTNEVTYKSMQGAYYDLVDDAVMSVAQGKESFDSAMYRQLKTIGEGGLRAIYPSGRTMRLDSAIRMNMKQGLTSMHNELQNQFGQEFGADGVEISVHTNPAPDHAPYQGRQFSKKEYEELQASLTRPIGMMNCYHYNFAIVLGVSKPEYTQKQLDAINEENEEGFEYEGKHYTNYEGQQRQRQLERAVREQKDTQILAKASGNKELIAESQDKIKALTDEYRKFSSASGLPTKMERMRVSGYQRTKVNNVINNEPKGFENSKIRDEKGNLIELYHGSKSEDNFKKFRYDPNIQSGDNFGEAYYFTSDYDAAKGYTYSSSKDERVTRYEKESKELWDKVISSKTQEERMKNWENYNNYKYEGKTLPQLLGDKEYWTGGSIKKVVLNVENPLIVNAEGENYDKIYPKNFKKAKENGNDGIIFKNVTDNARGELKKITTYVVFKPNQIEIVGNEKIKKTKTKS